jgi:hypothetical protein
MAQSVDFPYTPYPEELCVKQTGEESPFEAFLSILSNIMAHDPNPGKTTPYMKLCEINNIKLLSVASDDSDLDILRMCTPKSKRFKRFIVFVQGDSTHYRAVYDGKIYDPYDFFQSARTHGFCQMFAFLLASNPPIVSSAVGDLVIQTPPLVQYNRNPHSITQEDFNILAHNTRVCAIYTIGVIESNPELKELFREGFRDRRIIKRSGDDENDIRFRTTVDIYFKHFKKFLREPSDPYVAEFIASVGLWENDSQHDKGVNSRSPAVKAMVVGLLHNFSPISLGPSHRGSPRGRSPLRSPRGSPSGRSPTRRSPRGSPSGRSPTRRSPRGSPRGRSPLRSPRGSPRRRSSRRRSSRRRSPARRGEGGR